MTKIRRQKHGEVIVAVEVLGAFNHETFEEIF
jgi:hypothetical protein